MSLLSIPSVTGSMYVSSSYGAMGQGLTDRIFIVGHGDGLELNDPYHVTDIAAACKALNLDSTSPIIRTMLEVYYGGGLDIWLVAAAPMSEYIEDPAQRDTAYYQTYADRLEVTYSLLEFWDLVQILVLTEAPFYDAKSVDFVNPLIRHCETSFNVTGSIRVGLVGTRVGSALSQFDIDNMINDSRIGNWGSGGKFVSILAGEGTYSFAEMPASYTGSVIGAAAANMATLDLKLSLVYKTLPGIVKPIGILTKSMMSQLAEAQINPISMTSIGARGTPYQLVMMTDNTLALPGSDFWSLGQIRLIMAIISQLELSARRSLGTIGYGQYKYDNKSFMDTLQASGYLKKYTLDISRNPIDSNGIIISVSVTPYFDLRQISFTTTIGPGI